MASDDIIWHLYTKNKLDEKAECNWCGMILADNTVKYLKRHLQFKHKKGISKLAKYFELRGQGKFAKCCICNIKLRRNLWILLNHTAQKHSVILCLAPDKSEIKKYSIKDIEKGSLNNFIWRCLVGLIVEDGFSLNLCRSKNMKSIVEISQTFLNLNSKIVYGDEIEKTLGILSYYIRKDFSNKLHSRLLSVRIDSDINALPTTFCISTCYAGRSDVITHILGIIELKDDAELNGNHITQMLHKFNIDTSQITVALCDYSKRYLKKNVENNNEYFNEIEKFKLRTNIFIGDIRVEPYPGNTAQMCLINIFGNSNIFQPFLKCRKFVKFISEASNGYLEIFESNNLIIPQLDSPFIPGSTCEMMNNLLNARFFLEALKLDYNEKEENQFINNEYFWSFIEAFCTSTRPLQKSILMFRDLELEMGEFYGQWLTCKLATEMLYTRTTHSRNELLSMILIEVLNSIENQTNELLSRDHVTTCLYLDPRFQRILQPAQKASAIDFLKRLWYRSKLYSNDVVLQTVEKGDALFDEDALLDEFLSHDLQVKDNESNDVFKKIEGLTLAFQMDINIMSFWLGLKKREPEVYTLSKICLAAPATEIYFKQRYSHIFAMNDDADLSGYTKDNILYLQLNRHMLDKAISCLRDVDIQSYYETSDSETNDGPSTSKVQPYKKSTSSKSSSSFMEVPSDDDETS